MRAAGVDCAPVHSGHCLEKFGDPARTGADQVMSQADIYQVLEGALANVRTSGSVSSSTIAGTVRWS
jgi:hypothetical protein